MNVRRRAVVFGLALGFGLPHRTGRAARSEFKDLHLVTPTPPGSQPDQLARWLSDPLSRRSGARVLVVNRPGASGAIAADAVLASVAPETAALLLGGLDHVAYSHVNSQRRPLDPFSDFVPVAAINRDSWLVASAPGLATDLPGLARRARTNGSLNYGSTGEGSTGHLVSARLARALGIEAQHIPYKDSYLPDLTAGRLDFVVGPTPALIGLVRDQRLAALALLSADRSPLLPDVPSIAELGWRDQTFHGGLFLFAPASLEAHATQLNAWMVDAMQEPNVVEKYRLAGVEPTPLTLPQTRQSVADRLRLIDTMRMSVFGRAR